MSYYNYNNPGRFAYSRNRHDYVSQFAVSSSENERFIKMHNKIMKEIESHLEQEAIVDTPKCNVNFK
jgi:hypothetical protein